MSLSLTSQEKYRDDVEKYRHWVTYNLQVYNAVADNSWTIFIRLAVVAFQIYEIRRNSPKIRTYSN